MPDPDSRLRSVARIYDLISAGSLHRSDARTLATIFAADATHRSSGRGWRQGPAGAVELYLDLQRRLPGAIATVKRSAVDGDIVAVHWHAAVDPDDEFSGEAWCEFFRFERAHVVEHWQLHVDAPAATVSGRSVFSDAYPHAMPAGSGDAGSASRNRAVASAAFERFIAFDRSVVAEHWGDVYLQHNETIPDGVDALDESLEQVGGLPAHLRPRFTVLHTVARDDLVWFLERVDVGEASGFGADIFRLAGGRIVEHWDIPAMRPSSPDEPR
ncbi:nuclear transport factor 2 family protein [Microbacterium sp. NPDC091313]